MDETARTQPEFSPGERLATLEATINALDRRFTELGALFDEKLDGLRREVQAKSEAQKEAVDKAEHATATRFDTFAIENARKGDDTQKRLQALESNQSAGRGAAEFKSSTVAWITALAGLGLVVAALISAHAFG